MGQEASEGLFGGARTFARGSAMKLFWGVEQGPAPAVFATMLVCGIDEILRDDPASHLQTSDVAIELTAHLRTIKATGCSQFTSNQRTLFLQGKQDGLVDRTL